MSLETSTDEDRDERDVRPRPDATSPEGLQAWQFFVLAGLACATVATFMARGQSVASIVLLTVLMGATTIVGIAVLRTLRPLFFQYDDRTAMVGQRTRAALEREKLFVLRSIKELDFDRAMGKLSDSDWQEMSGRLRGRAARLMRQLDAGAGYRAQVERDLVKRLGAAAEDAEGGRAAVARFCGQCGAARDADARFCKQCGARL
jgi:pyruvate/2-oxoacid:ferredoxin oxidoreductase beta subunit